MTDPALDQRIQVLEDIEAIRRLKARYCACCDDDHEPEALAALFVADGVWEASGITRAEGHAAMKAYFGGLRASGRIRNSAHNVFNPQITVDGDSATGHWRLIMLYTGNLASGDVQYFRIIGWYTEEYVRVGGDWKFKTLYCQVEENAAYVTEADLII